jgi:hypothetical protein
MGNNVCAAHHEPPATHENDSYYIFASVHYGYVDTEMARAEKNMIFSSLFAAFSPATEPKMFRMCVS